MDSGYFNISAIISTFTILLLLFLTSSVCPVQSLNLNNNNTAHNLRHGNELKRPKYIKANLEKINKAAVKTTQVWSMSGDNNTIPTAEQDVLRATFVRRLRQRAVRKDGVDETHDHAIGYATGKFYGAQATVSVWLPNVENKDEFSISQMWIMDGTLEDRNLNSIEVGWKVEHGDKYPKLFIFWTRDAYQYTGCYNLDCPGFVWKNTAISPGSGIWQVSSYKGNQYDITLTVWRDRKDGNWWLQVNNDVVGYWPSKLFTLFKPEATVVEFGGEIVNLGPRGSHTRTEMGSGHFPGEGYGKAAYIRNIQVFDSKLKLHPAPSLKGVFEKPGCYFAGAGSSSKTWGTYMFYGGPGGNDPNCRRD